MVPDAVEADEGDAAARQGVDAGHAGAEQGEKRDLLVEVAHMDADMADRECGHGRVSGSSVIAEQL